MFYCPLHPLDRLVFIKGLLISCNDGATTFLSSPIFHEGRREGWRRWEDEVSGRENKGEAPDVGASGGGTTPKKGSYLALGLFVLPLILYRQR